MRTSPTNRLIEHLVLSMQPPPDGMDIGDGALLSRFVEHHEEAAFAALVHRHGPMVWGVCRRLLNRHDAEDAFQATFLVLARKASSIRSRETAGNWLYGVAHQTALHARRTAARRRAKEVQVTTMPDTEAVKPDPWADLQPLLDEELSRLPDIYRTVIVLCDLEGRTRKEVAFRLGVPEGTVAGRIARARTLLARRLTQRGVVLSGGALAAVLSQQGASAGVPNSVVASTIKAARLVAAGTAAGSQSVSVKVATLTEGVMKTMLFNKLKAATAVALTLGFVATGAMLLINRTAAGQVSKKPTAEKSVTPVPTQKKEEEAFTAWGKEVGGLQAGLGFLPGEHRVHYHGETVSLVVRVRNVGKVPVKFQYTSAYFSDIPPVVTAGDGKPLTIKSLAHVGKARLCLVDLEPGKEVDLHACRLELRPASASGSNSYWTLYGTGKFDIRWDSLTVEPDSVLIPLRTGKLELEVRPEPPPAAPAKGGAGPSEQKTNENLTPRKTNDPKAIGIIERAIKSHGGADALNKYTGGWSKTTSKATAADSDILITSETTFQYPDKYRTAIRIDIKPPANGIEVKGGPAGVQSSEIVQVFDGRKAKKTLNGAACELNEEEKAQLQSGFVLLNARRLTPLLDDRQYTLKAEQDVGDEQVVEVTANPLQIGRMPFSFFLGGKQGDDVKALDFPAKGVDAVRMFFDKKTGLLAKISHRAIDPSADDRKESTIDMLFADYKDVQGVKVPMKQLTRFNGKEMSTMTVIEAKMLEAVDPTTFHVK
jgi:RNA polymerase sigma factor (sigma-70 family)